MFPVGAQNFKVQQAILASPVAQALLPVLLGPSLILSGPPTKQDRSWVSPHRGNRG
jgi:hypothetical protein